jgi:signal transduction histidine kinase
MSEAMYRNLVESVPVAVYIDEGLDESSAIYRTRFMSPQIERMLGYPAEAFEADPELRWSLVHPDDRERAPANDRLHHETGRPTRSALRMIARIKTELVQLLSHELFTPITAIQGTADTLSLAGDRLSAEELHGLGEGVRAAASRLKRLVANLDAVMAVDREAALPTESLRVGEIVERAVAEFADNQDAQIVVVPSGDVLGRPVRAHAELAARAVVLVTENALDFRGGSPVEIAVVGSDREVSVEISDRAPGVPVDQRERIFELFTQAEGASARSHEGLGIGLYLARRIMTTQGGRLELREREGGGTTFALTFPGERESRR